MDNENSVNETNKEVEKDTVQSGTEQSVDNTKETQSDSTYHYGRNESPFGREDVSGNGAATYYQTSNENASGQTNQTGQNANPYSQGSVYGQGIYTGNNFAEAPKPEKKRKTKKAKKPGSGKGKRIATFIGAAAAFGLIAGGVMVGVNTAGNRLLGNSSSKTQIPTVTTADSGIQSNKSENKSGYADVAEEVMPSIVAITNTSVQTVQSWFQSYEQEVTGSGSGIIIGQTDDEILIATNNHVIEGASELTVVFNDETAVSASVKGADTVADLAVVSVKTSDLSDDTLSNIKVAALGSSDDLKVGNPVIAIGNALGYGQSLTAGYISAVDREVDVEDTSMRLLQTDAAINPGNSGGALLNENGEVIGINTVKYVDSTVEGMGYAIPISTAIPIINDLMNQEVIEESEQGYLGIQGKEITDEYASGFNMPNGVYVVKIVEDSPADQCGLKAGDIITKFAGRDVNSMEALQNILTGKKAGEEVEMVVQRNNEKGEYEEVTLKVKLGAKKDMPDTTESTESKDKQKSTQSEKSTQQQEVSPEEFFNEYFGN